MKNIVENLANASALLGGLVLIAVVILTTASIFGRAFISLGLAPIPGDFELVEIGIGVAVFSALPLCHLRRGHATVDLFSAMFSPRFNRFLDITSDLLVLAISALITRQLWLGMLDKRQYFETTFILQMPLWWGYLACVIMAVVLCIVALFRVGETLSISTGTAK
jgi:TRAP-type C4-dicarboxylate transport system permease small subunit